MHQESLRLLIQRKIDAGSLPRDGIQRLWGAYANADSCDACNKVIRGHEYVIEGISVDGDGKRAVQFHVQCFAFCVELRQVDRDAVCTFCGKRIAATQEQSRIQGEPFHDSCWDQMQKRPESSSPIPRATSRSGGPSVTETR